jgi:hypothetical protein
LQGGPYHNAWPDSTIIFGRPKSSKARETLIQRGVMKKTIDPSGTEIMRSIHPGRHLDEYMKRVENDIGEVFNLHKAGKLTKDQARTRVQKIQSELGQGLRDGSIPLTHEDRNRLLKGALSIGGLVVITLSAEDRALAAEAMAQIRIERAEEMLADPSVTKVGYLSAETYTGKEGTAGWIGWGIDLANPAADLMLIPEATSLLVNMFSDPSLDSFTAEQVRERMEQLRRQKTEQ